MSNSMEKILYKLDSNYKHYELNNIFDNSFAIGDYKIDSQHKRLFEIFENLLEALGEGKGKDVILE
ncbi:MAG: hypothetical protein QXE44_07595, partial [Nitrososphaerota archaeon]